VTPTPNDYHAYAEAKLRVVLGEAKAASALTSTLESLGLRRIETVEDLHRFGRALVAAGGFAGAVGGLLTVHAVMHGARAD
jgi:hypothetical protein